MSLASDGKLEQEPKGRRSLRKLVASLPGDPEYRRHQATMEMFKAEESLRMPQMVSTTMPSDALLGVFPCLVC